MAEEHDLWLERIGVRWFKSGVRAVGDLAEAGFDVARAEGAGVMGAGGHIGAGILDAVGAHDMAGRVREGANRYQDEAKQYLGSAGRELGKAEDEIFGNDQNQGRGRRPSPEIPGPKPAPQDARMRPDCKPIRGKVPGPVNHLLCATHGHVVDVKAGTIIAGSLAEYKKLHCAKPSPPSYSGSGNQGGKVYGGNGGQRGGQREKPDWDEAGPCEPVQPEYEPEEPECPPPPQQCEPEDTGSASVTVGQVSGSFEAGVYNDPETGASMVGVKMSAKAVGVEVNADTPLGNVSASFLKAEGSAQAGYEYDPESQVEFAGVKASGSISVFDGKVQGKYGNLSGQLLSASASSKTGIEVDEKTGKIFIGTANSAEAKVAEASGTLQTADGSAQLTGGVQVLKASASLDANAVVDKYGIDVNEKIGAEANLVKAEAGGEIRLTPKALFDNTVGWMTNTTAPDFLDIGPVLGAKVSAGEGVGGTLEAGCRVGVDEVNVRGGGFIELAEGVGLDLKAGMRLGPLKSAYDNKDAIVQTATELGNAAEQQVSAAASTVADLAASGASSAVETAKDLANAASSTWDSLFS